MRYSQMFIPTLKEAPADAQVASHRLLVRAGFVRQLSAGIYSILPLAQRSLNKIHAVIREEMAAIGARYFSRRILALSIRPITAGRASTASLSRTSFAGITKNL